MADETIDKVETVATDTTAAVTDKAATASTATATLATSNGDTAATDTTKPAADATAADWRAKMAGEDKDFYKRLGRFTDEASFAKSYRALEQKLSSGEYRKALPDNATPEEKATWRKENGLPEKAEDYLGKLSLPTGLVLGEEDKPIVAEFAAQALEDGIGTKEFNGLVAKYYAIQDAQRAEREQQDANFRRESEEALRVDWEGPNYRRNLTAVNNLLSTWPEGLAAKVLGGRDADGRLLGDNPTFIRQLAQVALDLNPHATLVPAGTTDPAKSVEAELAAIRETRRNEPEKYERDKAMQARELELLDATLKGKARAA